LNGPGLGSNVPLTLLSLRCVDVIPSWLKSSTGLTAIDYLLSGPVELRARCVCCLRMSYAISPH
jgi:hypothetical protein